MGFEDFQSPQWSSPKENNTKHTTLKIVPCVGTTLVGTNVVRVNVFNPSINKGIRMGMKYLDPCHIACSIQMSIFALYLHI